MRRLLALLLLSLPLSAWGQADGQAFARSLEDWRALFRPLATARGPALIEATEAIARDHPARAAQVLDRFDLLLEDSVGAADAAVMDAIHALQVAYDRADARERRALMRLVAKLGDSFGEKDAPAYPICQVGAFAIRKPAQDLFDGWVRSDANASMGLLDDADPRVAEAAVRAYQGLQPEAAILRLQRWRRSPQARFRGIVVQWASLLGEAESLKVLRQFLSDQSDDIRDASVREYPYRELKREYPGRRKRFEGGTWGERRSILAMAQRLEAPDRISLAKACLGAPTSSLRLMALNSIAFGNEGQKISETILARLRKDASPEVREAAYEQSGRQHIPMRDLRAGLSDPDREVRASAFGACTGGVQNLAEFRLLLGIGLKTGDGFKLRPAAHHLGEAVEADVSDLLRSDDPQARELGISLACELSLDRMGPALEKLLSDPETPVRMKLAWETQSLPKEIAGKWLDVLVKDGAPEVRRRAEDLRKDLASRSGS